MRFRIAHLLWLTACCGLAFLLFSLPLVMAKRERLWQGIPVWWTEIAYPVAEPFFRGVLWTAVLVAGVLWLNETPMRFRRAHLLWFTACCGLAAWLIYLPLATTIGRRISSATSTVVTWREPAYPLAEPFGRGVLWTIAFIAGILWLSRKHKSSTSAEQK